MLAHHVRALFPVLFAASFLGNAQALMAADSARSEPEPPLGSLMMIGGAERDTNDLLWQEFVRLAGGKGKTVAVFPTASTYPERTGRLYAEFLTKLGLQPFVVPLSPLWPDASVGQVARDPNWIARVGEADAVLLTGGEQLRYRLSLLDTDEQPTPLLEAMLMVYRRGGVIAGTSAGMAVMSRVMFVNAEFQLPVLRDGAIMGREVNHGLGLAPEDWFVDQHFLTRGRFARTLVAMKTYGFPFGIGVDEDTAVVISKGRTATVVGYRGATILDASQATSDPAESRYHWRGIRLSYLSHGDSIDLKSRKVTPGPEKRDEFRIDPFAPNFKPYYLGKQFYNDITANMMLLEVMYKLVDSPHDEAIGLAYDGAAARRDVSTPGFEFRFTRTKDSVSWDSPTAIGDPNTVLNVMLDIRPITINGPLYK